MLSGAYHSQLPVKSISSATPEARNDRNSQTSQIDMPSNTVEPATITVRIAFILLLPQHANPAIMSTGTITNQIKIFPNMIISFAKLYEVNYSKQIHVMAANSNAPKKYQSTYA